MSIYLGVNWDTNVTYHYERILPNNIPLKMRAPNHLLDTNLQVQWQKGYQVIVYKSFKEKSSVELNQLVRIKQVFHIKLASAVYKMPSKLWNVKHKQNSLKILAFCCNLHEMIGLLSKSAMLIGHLQLPKRHNMAILIQISNKEKELRSNFCFCKEGH